MEFGWINLAGAVIVGILMIPNILYALRNRGEKNKCENRIMNLTEQAGRYMCILFMWFPLFTGKFGFHSVQAMLLYLAGNGLLLAGYLLVWGLYFHKKTDARAMALAVIPTALFLWSGVLLRHWILVISALLFGVGHIFVTRQNLRLSGK